MTPLTRRLQVVDSSQEVYVLQVAFATTDREYVNQHFGSSRAFAIYGVNEQAAQLLSVCEFSDLEEGADDKLHARIEAVSDCGAVYCRACGASAVRQLLTRGIQPGGWTEEGPINELIAALQGELRQGPSTWLANAIRSQSRGRGRFDSMEAEGWDE